MKTKRQTGHSSRFRTLLLLSLTFVLGGGLLVGCGTGADREADSDGENAVTAVRTGVVESIERVDRDVEAETTANGMRVGISLNEPVDLYEGEDVVSEAAGSDRQLRVVLREERTKRKLPGSEVQVQFLDGDGNVLDQTYLLETWGDYYFYGKNVTLPDAAETLRVNVTPPLIGRHEDMKELYLDPVTTSFELNREEDELSVAGSAPSDVSDDVRLGSDVETAADEALELKQNGGYRIGFIAEGSEPFWVFSRHRDNEDSPRSLRMADFPQSANRHLEIVLFDAETHRIVPHAGVELDVRAEEGEARTRVELPFLMSAFNHYGNSLYLPQADYDVEATISNPDLHTLEPNQFPGEVTVNYDWSPEE